MLRLLLVTALLPVTFVSLADEGAVFYAEKVYPLLKENCFECHGGGEKLKGDFRITSRDGLLLGGHFGSAYDAENPADSILLEMVSYEGEDYQMPPDGKLPAASIAILRKWVDLGVPYDPDLEIKGEARERRGFSISEKDRDWWAYRPLSHEDPPQSSWGVNAIDAFVKTQLEREKLSANPPAAPEVLIRRLFYDLIGLPPTPQEVADFVTASETDSDAAYRFAVDDLLSRPQYGEKWARHWLDLVRYAESNGFERDNSKPHIWRYRDYVIDAFNSNKPYDEFVIEQLAGDEIKNPTKESMIATGYHRLMQWDDEPADRKQHVYDVLADNVQITTETFLATTVGCARCHNHKADPISQRDFYSFMAFLSNVTHYETAGTIVNWAGEEEKARFAIEREQNRTELRREKLRLENDLRTALTKLDLHFTGDEGVTFVKDAASGGEKWWYTLTQPTTDWNEVGFQNKNWFSSKNGFGSGTGTAGPVRAIWESDEIWGRTIFQLTTLPDTLTLEISHTGPVEVYLNGALVYESVMASIGYESIALPPTSADYLQTGKNIVAVHSSDGGTDRYLDLALASRSASSQLARLVGNRQQKSLGERVEKAVGEDLFAQYREVLRKNTELRSARPGVPLNVVMESGAVPEPLHIHLRGSAHAPGDEVSPGLPAVLASEDSMPRAVEANAIERDGRASSGRRLALAKWIVDPQNSITARVFVNRIWQHHFGRGIVPSSSDFGALGEKPSHPELLDWLAREFVTSGWDIKAMHRLILRSRTYRMSSEPDSGNLASDPQNINLWRYPMRRLTAEEIRDSILAVSGDLNLETHGPWVYPPLPPEVLATASRPGKGWPVSQTEADQNRRSIYVHVKRSLRHQMLADFDQADTDTTCAVRFATTVPTQALTMLNSRFVNDQASQFAARLAKVSDDPREQIAEGIAIALQRSARADELDHLVSLRDTLEDQQKLTAEEALARVALVILNLNEFLYLD